MIISPGLADELFRRRNEQNLSLGTVVYADKPNDPLQAKVDEMIESLNNSLYGRELANLWFPRSWIGALSYGLLPLLSLGKKQFKGKSKDLSNLVKIQNRSLFF